MTITDKYYHLRSNIVIMSQTLPALFIPDLSTALELPLYNTLVPAGFPSPADNYLDKALDLNEYLINNADATFFVKVSGDSMIGAKIFDGDMLIVDRSLEPKDGDIIVGIVCGEFTIKYLSKKKDKVALLPANPKYQPIEITEDMGFQVWGVATYTIHSNRKR